MTDPILLEYWGEASFRGINHCPICLVRKPCPCDQLPLPEPAEPEPEQTVLDGPDWLARRDLA